MRVMRCNFKAVFKRTRRDPDVVLRNHVPRLLEVAIDLRIVDRRDRADVRSRNLREVRVRDIRQQRVRAPGVNRSAKLAKAVVDALPRLGADAERGREKILHRLVVARVLAADVDFEPFRHGALDVVNRYGLRHDDEPFLHQV